MIMAGAGKQSFPVRGRTSSRCEGHFREHVQPGLSTDWTQVYALIDLRRYRKSDGIPSARIIVKPTLVLQDISHHPLRRLDSKIPDSQLLLLRGRCDR